MLEPRSVITHHIVGPWEVPGLVTVSVFPLVEGADIAQLGGRPVIGDGASVNSRLGGSVVSEVSESGVGGLMGRGHETSLPDEGTMLQITVSD